MKLHFSPFEPKTTLQKHLYALLYILEWWKCWKNWNIIIGITWGMSLTLLLKRSNHMMYEESAFLEVHFMSFSSTYIISFISLFLHIAYLFESLLWGTSVLSTEFQSFPISPRQDGLKWAAIISISHFQKWKWKCLQSVICLRGTMRE